MLSGTPHNAPPEIVGPSAGRQNSYKSRVWRLEDGLGLTWLRLPGGYLDIEEYLASRVGRVTGVGEWHTITQAAIDMFAEATRDDQWIHVDAARAARGPFGATIAHGFMTLALIPGIGPLLEPPGVRMTINYGLNRVRFVSPVPVGSRVRVVRELAGFSRTGAGFKVDEKVTIELEGSDRPACVAETVILLVE